jgi:ribosome modulation factor
MQNSFEESPPLFGSFVFRMEGRDARDNSFDLTDCPYATGTEPRAFWLAGWIEQHPIESVAASKIESNSSIPLLDIAA